MNKIIFTSTKTCFMCKLAIKSLEAAMLDITHPDITFEYKSLDDDPKFGTDNGITTVPTVLFIKDDTIVQTVTGVKSKIDYSQTINSIWS